MEPHAFFGGLRAGATHYLDTLAYKITNTKAGDGETLPDILADAGLATSQPAHIYLLSLKYLSFHCYMPHFQTETEK